MSSKKDHEFKESLEKCYSLVQQSSAKGDISAAELAKKLGKHRTTVHGYLNTLEYMGKIESQHGTWHAKTGEQTIKPLEKEILIELPLPKSEVQRMALLEHFANDWEESFPNSESIYKTVLEKFRETRTIRITGKNVDDLDLDKVANLVQQANEKSFSVNLKRVFKSLRKSRPTNSKPEQSSET